MRYPVVLTASVFLLSSVSSWSATKMKPGLWEFTSKVDLGQQIQMPQLTPEIRAQMEALGVQIPTTSAVTNQECITPEQAAKETIPDFNDPESGCKVHNSKRKGDTVTADMVCTGQTKAQGNMTFNILSPERVEGLVVFSGESQGFQAAGNSKSTGRWVSSDCGNVQPRK